MIVFVQSDFTIFFCRLEQSLPLTNALNDNFRLPAVYLHIINPLFSNFTDIFKHIFEPVMMTSVTEINILQDNPMRELSRAKNNMCPTPYYDESVKMVKSLQK